MRSSYPPNDGTSSASSNRNSTSSSRGGGGGSSRNSSTGNRPLTRSWESVVVADGTALLQSNLAPLLLVENYELISAFVGGKGGAFRYVFCLNT